MNKYVLTDTCFWIGLVDPKDQFHDKSKEILTTIEDHYIIVPWPCLYETISTHLTRRRDRLLYFEKIIRNDNIILISDEEYKENGIAEVFRNVNQIGITHSLVDSIIREMLKNINLRIDYLVTYNESDFEDLCQKRRIFIYN
jgi:predicted nucleic acid-binding protein